MNQVKYIFIIGCILLSYFSMGCFNKNLDDTYILYVDSHGTKQYTSIQQAIDASPENYTIYVYSGIYYENIFINKSLILKGEKKERTIIDGNLIGDVILIDEGSRANISGFTICHSGQNESHDKNAGIRIKSDNNSIMDTIICNNTIGIYSSFARNNTFKQNIIDSNTVYGMYLDAASHFSNITENVFMNNSYALRILESKNNIITKNIFSDNYQGIYFCCGSISNTVYHNTFINNSLWSGRDDVGGNYWDNGYPTGGNYWDNYTSSDEYQGINQDIPGTDGISDTAYNISSTGDKRDRYPLMEPIRMS